MKKQYLVGGFQSKEDITRLVQEDFLGVRIYFDEELSFYNFFIPEIEDGTKNCTIRFKPSVIRMPFGIDGSSVLPCYATDPEGKKPKEKVGLVQLDLVVVSDVADFPEKLAQQDGFGSKEHMIAGISEIYNHELQPTDYLSLYSIEGFHRSNI